MTGISGHPIPGMRATRDCIHHLQLEITNPATGALRTSGKSSSWNLGQSPYFLLNLFTGPFGGTFKDLVVMKTISWSGRLIAFAGRADDVKPEFGLCAISFVGHSASGFGNDGYSVSSEFGGSDLAGMMPFNDAGTFDLDPQRPIVNVVVTSGANINGIK